MLTIASDVMPAAVETTTAPSAAVPEAPAAGPEAATQQQAAEPSPVTAMDIRIGQITSIEKHPDADSLYVEQVG